MTRTLALIAVVGFVLAVACFAGTLAIVGGPFSIDDGWRFHREAWGADNRVDGRTQTPRPTSRSS